MERVVTFLDYANTNAGLMNLGVAPDYGHIGAYLGEGRFVVEQHAFVPLDPRNPHGRDGRINELWGSGWLVHTKLGAFAGDSYKCDFDVEMTLELMQTAEIVWPDIIVLVSGDKDFVPVILELRRRGIRVEVAAIPNCNAARELIQKASGFIDLREYLQGGQGIGNDDPEPDLLSDNGDLADSDPLANPEVVMLPGLPEALDLPVIGATGYPRPPVVSK